MLTVHCSRTRVYVRRCSRSQLIQLLWFIAIILVFLLAWGVAQYSLLYPQAYQSGWILRDFIDTAYWQMMTQFYLAAAVQSPPYDTTNQTNMQCTSDASTAGLYTMQRCADTSVNWIVVIGLAVRTRAHIRVHM